MVIYGKLLINSIVSKGGAMYHIIVNPVSQTGKGMKLWESLIPTLSAKDILYHVYFTKKCGHATELVATLTEKLSKPIKIIILGGDGTLNEAIQGIKDFNQTFIGYIPTGSSNDFARDLSMGNNPVKSLLRILSCETPILMDLGMVTYLDAIHRLENFSISEKDSYTRLFSVSADMGFGAAVCEEALHSPIKNFFNKFGLGKLTYLGIALRQIIKAPSASLKLTLDDETPMEFSSFLLAGGFIHRFEGGGFKFAPDADAFDGLLDVCLAANLKTLRSLRILPSAFSGKHVKFKEIHMFRCQKMCIEASEPLWVHTDGEVDFKARKVLFSCLPGKLHLLY